MEIFDNITETVKHDMETSINKGSRLDIAAACFSIYAYQEMKKQLEDIDKLRFICFCWSMRAGGSWRCGVTSC